MGDCPHNFHGGEIYSTLFFPRSDKHQRLCYIFCLLCFPCCWYQSGRRAGGITMKYTATDGHIPFVAGFIPHSVFVPQFQFHLIFPRSVFFLASWCFMPIFWVKESTMVWLNSCRVKIKFLLLKTRTLVVTPHAMLFQKWHTMFSFDPQPFSSCFYASAPRYGDQGALLLRLDLTSWDAAFRRVPTCFWFSQGQRKGSISHLNHVAISDISDG